MSTDLQNKNSAPLSGKKSDTRGSSRQESRVHPRSLTRQVDMVKVRILTTELERNFNLQMTKMEWWNETLPIIRLLSCNQELARKYISTPDSTHSLTKKKSQIICRASYPINFNEDRQRSKPRNASHLSHRIRNSAM